MLPEGTQAPDFTLADQFGRRLSLSQFKHRAHVMLVFYPLDFTPT